MPPLKRRQARGPISGAGLIRYFDVDEGGIRIDPKVFLGLVIAFIFIELLVSFIF